MVALSVAALLGMAGCPYERPSPVPGNDTDATGSGTVGDDGATGPGGDDGGVITGDDDGDDGGVTTSGDDDEDDDDDDGVTTADSRDSGDDATTVDGDDDDDDDGTDSTSTCEAPACADGEACLVVPDGWNGPIAARTVAGAAATPDCEGDFTESLFVGLTGLVAADAECSCACDDADAACPEATTLRQYNNSASCPAQLGNAVRALSEGCNDIPYYDDVSFFLDTPFIDLDGVECAPSASTVVPTAAWTEQVAGCGLPAGAETCGGGGACAPTVAADDQLCIWAEGDVECEDPNFTERQVLHQDLQDDRSCSTCECGEPEGACEAEFTLRAGENCLVGSPGGGASGACVDIVTPARSVSLSYTQPDVTCSPSGGVAEGSADPIDAVTLCCAP